MPVGSTKPKSVDVRFVAATNKALEQEVAAGRFREDLFYRLSVITIHVPPLRERLEDVEPLARHFVRFFAKRMKKAVTGIAPDALQQLTSYHWPGNVRELKNVIERAVILARTGRITADLLPTWSKAAPLAPGGAGSGSTLESLEKNHILQVLVANGYHKSRSADILGISRKTLARKIVEYGLPDSRD
jgi:two-component system response regulator HydG